MLLSWADSRIVAAARGISGAAQGGGIFVCDAARSAGQPNPVWETDRISGADWRAATEAPREIEGDCHQTGDDLSCDVCVIGSGAGGGVAAAVLAAAGKEVIVLEAGGYFDDADFDGAELTGFKSLYSECGFASTRDHSVGFLAGECLGGGTVVNYCTSFRTPREIREEWAGAGVEWIRGAEFTQSLGAVCARLNVNQAHNHVSKREEMLERGLRRLGWHVDAMPRNVIGCDQGKVCGYCGYGCAIGAKQSTVKTWLADAQAHGAKFVVETRAERVRVERGVATGVEARTKNGHRVIVKCKQRGGGVRRDSYRGAAAALWT